MSDMWKALEEHTRAWRDRERQAVADTVWGDYVTARFSRTGDRRALQFLYPYLNRADRHVRIKALEVAGRVFEGSGPAALPDLDYVTANTDPFLRDRAAIVVGAAVTGWDPPVVHETLRPYLNHRNRFIQRTAMTALARATARSASEAVLDEIIRVAEASGAGRREVAMAVATVFEGRPTARAYALVADLTPGPIHYNHDEALGILTRGSSAEWYERACRDVFDRRLGVKARPGEPWLQYFEPRNGVLALGPAGTGRGIDPLRRMLVARFHRPEVYAMLREAQKCFHQADADANRAPLVELLKTGDVSTQRVAAVCLGRLLIGSGDEEAAALLIDLTRARNAAVRAGAVRGLGMLAQSTLAKAAGERCLQMADDEETAAAAIGAFGRIYLGSGQADVFAHLRDRAQAYRHRPTIGRHRYLPLQACYESTGRLYLGTGATDPVDFLLDPIVQSRAAWDNYRWAAGRSLVMIEFPASTMERAWGVDWE